jgi:hypothetical protein
MSDDGHHIREQRRREILAAARATLERLDRQRVTEREMCAAAKAELQLVSALIEMFELLAQALAEARKGNTDYLSGQVVAMWKAMAAVHGQIAGVHDQRIQNLLASEPRDPATRLH